MLFCGPVRLVGQKMRKAIEDTLKENIEQAIADGYSMGRYFSLVEENDCYMPPSSDSLSCHPLETLVLGQRITDCINCQIATYLGVGLRWVDGFQDALGDSKDKKYLELDPDDILWKRYIEGYHDGRKMERWIRQLESSRYSPD